MLVEREEEKAALQNMPQPDCLRFAQYHAHTADSTRSILARQTDQITAPLIGSLTGDDRVHRPVLVVQPATRPPDLLPTPLQHHQQLTDVLERKLNR